MDPIDLLRQLLDPDRVAIVGAVAARPGDAAEVARRAGAYEQDVIRTLAPLVQGGLVERVEGSYRIVAEGWREVARELPQPPPASRRVAFGMTEDEAKVLAPFFQGDRLIELPANYGKRRVVLERLALEFEPGMRYAEREVNEILHRFNDDHATLRRLLVDEGLLDRASGEYWRSGGRVP